MVSTIKTKSLDKYYNISKVLLTLSPFVCLLYLSTGAARMGASIQQVIEADPKFLIMFLASMVNPFIAYLLIYMHKRINDGDISYAVVNLVVLIVAEFIFQNALYMFLLGFILYKTIKTYNISIKSSFKDKIKDKFLMVISGGIVVIIFASICLFATIRVEMF
ncbi:hypothetical protein [Clostridium butyricum]|uniref:Uncharacterized protein n=1 Tax=Clostridium butyricum TaxID=1492 RepID=A0A2S7FDH1_CLOBU|nr:hypothetical protein [Clostridium butyricum]APF21472.1 putative membrane protein [Clostridium butyricum]EMU52580.1 hypothetical protein CBDKU1_35060 [Clostridium butyricum DKU-01]KHD14744.1 hypothetical protein OA81_13790 [Clostridium butyricum]MBZ0313817.1 hypothetical protein [Clostridium butyricum]MDB2151912.1 hypothetical protein [Clostridium butyricum]